MAVLQAQLGFPCIISQIPFSDTSSLSLVLLVSQVSHHLSMPSVCVCCCHSCCGCCWAYMCPCTACADSCLFDLVCPQFVPIHLCLHLLSAGCSCCHCHCAYAHPHAGPGFLCACPVPVFSVCSTLPVKAILGFLNRKSYLSWL